MWSRFTGFLKFKFSRIHKSFTWPNKRSCDRPLLGWSGPYNRVLFCVALEIMYGEHYIMGLGITFFFFLKDNFPVIPVLSRPVSYYSDFILYAILAVLCAVLYVKGPLSLTSPIAVSLLGLLSSSNYIYCF